MTRSFGDSIASDVENVFFNTNEFAILVTLARGVITTASVAAIVESRSYDVTSLEGIPTAVQSYDFDLATSAYAFESTTETPQVGDVITNAGGERFEVMPMSKKQCFEVMSDGIITRVHTKKVE